MATQPQISVRQRERAFYISMAVAASAIIFAGFARTYYLRDLFGQPPLPGLLHLHGFLFSCWFLLLLTQVTLIATKRTDLHRRLGVAGAVLVVLMIGVGTATAIHAARRGVGTELTGSPLSFLVIPLGDIVTFSILAAAGLLYRRHSDVHKRLMLLATIAILPPGIARLPFAFIQNTGPLTFFGLTDLVLFACVLYDSVAHRRLHPAFLWGGLFVAASHPLRLFVARTDAWLAFAQWLIR